MLKIGYGHYNDNMGNMLGVTMKSVENLQDEQLVFKAEDGRVFVFHHQQDCCESVAISDITGELDDLVGAPLLRVEARSQDGPPDDYGSSTWTFYEFATIKGSVTVRWVGESNGYYSESVDFAELKEEELDQTT